METLEERISGILTGADVARELQTSAGKIRNANTRFYKFWKFVGSLCRDEVSAFVRNMVEFDWDNVSDFTEESDTSKHVGKLEKSLKVLNNLDLSIAKIEEKKKATDSGDEKKVLESEKTALVSAKTQILEDIKQTTSDTQTSLEKIKNTQNTQADYQKKKGLKAGLDERKKWSSFTFDLILPHICSTSKKLFDEFESTSETRLKSLEAKASYAGPTAENLTIVKEALKHRAKDVDWTKVAVDMNLEMHLDVLDHLEKHRSKVGGEFAPLPILGEFGSKYVFKYFLTMIGSDVKKYKRSMIKNLSKSTIQKIKGFSQDLKETIFNAYLVCDQDKLKEIPDSSMLFISMALVDISNDYIKKAGSYPKHVEHLIEFGKTKLGKVSFNSELPKPDNQTQTKIEKIKTLDKDFGISISARLKALSNL